MQSVKEIKQQLMCYLDAKWYSKIVKHDHHTELMVCVKQIAKSCDSLISTYGEIVEIKKIAAHIPEIFDNTEDLDGVYCFVSCLFRDVKASSKTYRVTVKFPSIFAVSYNSFPIKANSKADALIAATDALETQGINFIEISNIELYNQIDEIFR